MRRPSRGSRSPRRRALPALLGAVGLVLTLGACGGDGPDDTETVTVTSEVTPEPSDDDTATDESSPTDEGTDDDGSTDGDETSGETGDDDAEAPVPFPANTDPDTEDPSSGAMLTVTDVRTGHHDGYDRVVFELDGEGTPGWRVEYVGSPADDGSGSPVDIDGDTFVQVSISGSGYPTDTGVDEYSGPDPVEATDSGVIEEVRLRGVFEGYTQAFIGVDDGPRPFRAFLLEDPTRVVVDVRDDG